MTDRGAEELAVTRLGEGVELLEAMRDRRLRRGRSPTRRSSSTGRCRAGGKLLLFGNGGSAADALHIAAEFVGRYLLEREPLPALALMANPSAVTAIGNDYGFDEVFARQVRALAVPGDVAIGLTTSGVSPNVVLGLLAAREAGMRDDRDDRRHAGPAGEAADLRPQRPQRPDAADPGGAHARRPRRSASGSRARLVAEAEE